MNAILAALVVAVAVGSAGCPAAADVSRGRSGAPPVAAPATPTPSRGAAALERRVLALVNRHRTRQGLVPLALDLRVSDEARRHSAAMAAGWTPVGHRGFEARLEALQRSMPVRSAAENVAGIRDYEDAAAEAMRGWLASPAHRESIEGPYDRTGIGVVSNRAGEVYFTQLFVGR